MLFLTAEAPEIEDALSYRQTGQSADKVDVNKSAETDFEVDISGGNHNFTDFKLRTCSIPGSATILKPNESYTHADGLGKSGSERCKIIC